MKEEWKDIPGYEGLYQISSFGRVKSLAKKGGNNKNQKEHFMNFIINRYVYVSLCKNSKNKQVLVHKLVANAFIPNPDHLPFLNHIDYNKENNRVDNLEWCTAKENSQWSVEHNRQGQLKKNKPLSGHHYIQKRSETSFRFMYNKNGKSVARVNFHTLEEAIEYRDKWLSEHEPQIRIEVK